MSMQSVSIKWYDRAGIFVHFTGKEVYFNPYGWKQILYDEIGGKLVVSLENEYCPFEYLGWETIKQVIHEILLPHEALVVMQRIRQLNNSTTELMDEE